MSYTPRSDFLHVMQTRGFIADCTDLQGLDEKLLEGSQTAYIGYDATVLRGDPETRKFTVVYMKEASPIAFDCVNTMKDYVQGRKLLERGIDKVDPALLEDTEVQLKELM